MPSTRTIRFRPRLASLDLLSAALLISAGVLPSAACSSEVRTEDGGGGGGSNNGGGNPITTSNNGGFSSSGGFSSTMDVSPETSVDSTSTGMGGGVHGCVNPMPLIVEGQDTGYDTCDGGQLRRREVLACPTNFPDDDPCCGECPDGTVCSDAGEIACTCVDACSTDAECGPDQVCMCGDTAGICVPAGCQTGADCNPGEECNSWDSSQGCLYFSFVCTTSVDTCGGDLDCKDGGFNNFCVVHEDGARHCEQGGCPIGRPFLIEDVARVAPIESRRDWCDEEAIPSCETLDARDRTELSAAWEYVARMEHASIAAFARFSMQLLAFGAPADLVARASDAMRDETKHAKLAFAFASAYRAEPIGPGRLDMSSAMDRADDVASFVGLLIREGCVGETVAAVEAGEAAESAIDPVVRSALQTIATDEASHAELAWRTLAWALETFGDEARAALDHEIARVVAAADIPVATTPDPRERVLLAHGVVSERGRAEIRRVVLARAVLPCLRRVRNEQTAVAAPSAFAVLADRA